MIRFVSLYRILAALSLVFALVARAQVVGGTISGTVHDVSGAVVAGATVTVHQTETGAARVISTDSEGRFTAPSVPVGPYSVFVADQSFESQKQDGLCLAVGQTLQVNFVLGLATVQQPVLVDAVSRDEVLPHGFRALLAE